MVEDTDFETLFMMEDDEQIEFVDTAIRKQHADARIEMAKAVIDVLHQAEAYGDMWELVNDMYDMDEELVSNLEFIISQCFIDKNQPKGGRYAN